MAHLLKYHLSFAGVELIEGSERVASAKLFCPLTREALSSFPSRSSNANLRTSTSSAALHCNEYMASARCRAASPSFWLRSRSAQRSVGSVGSFCQTSTKKRYNH